MYPGAGHGFINDHDPADMTLLLTILNKVSGTRYHEPSATDAHRRIAPLLPPSPGGLTAKITTVVLAEHCVSFREPPFLAAHRQATSLTQPVRHASRGG